MKKIALLLGLSLLVPQAWADIADDIADLKVRMKQIEVRMGLVERDMGELKESNKAPSVPINQANLPSAQVLIWASESIEQIYTYNYHNFPQVLTDIRRFFTQQGYDSYMKALNDSNNIQIVQDKRLYVAGKVREKGKVVKEGVNGGIYTWEIQIPLIVNYKTSNESLNQNIVANVEIVRVPTSDNPIGIAIHSITATVEGQGSQAPIVPATK